jgi:hypothetical protein
MLALLATALVLELVLIDWPPRIWAASASATHVVPSPGRLVRSPIVITLASLAASLHWLTTLVATFVFSLALPFAMRRWIYAPPPLVLLPDAWTSTSHPCIPRRILINGAPASGKTTLGRALAAALNVRLVSTDEFRWASAKGGAESADFLDQVLARTSEPGWILEGNWRRLQNTIGSRLSVDLVIDLATPRWLIYVRLARRDLWRCLRCRPGSSDLWWVAHQPHLRPVIEDAMISRWGAETAEWI